MPSRVGTKTFNLLCIGAEAENAVILEPPFSFTTMDPKLKRYCNAPSESLAERELELLLKVHIIPIIQSKLRNKMNWQQGHGTEAQDAEDIQIDVCANITKHLREHRSKKQDGSLSKSIENLKAYVALSAINGFNEYLRKKYPERRKVEARIRKLLDQPGFAHWRNDNAEIDVGGFAEWQDKKPFFIHKARVNTSCPDPRRFLQEYFPYADDPNLINPALLLAHLFNDVGYPIPFNDIVTFFVKVWDVKEIQLTGLPQGSEPSYIINYEGLKKPDIQRLWECLHTYKSIQIASIVLDFKGKLPAGTDLVDVLMLDGIPFKEIARALFWEMMSCSERTTAQESSDQAQEDRCIEKLNLLKNDLPMKDEDIGAIWGVQFNAIADARRQALRKLRECPTATEEKER